MAKYAKLKRCEICKWSGHDYHDFFCTKKRLKDAEVGGYKYEDCPDSRTCDDWQWDKHGKDTE